MPREQITYERYPGTIVSIDGDGPAAMLGSLSVSSDGTPEQTSTPVTAFPTLHVAWHKDAHGNGWAQFMFRCDPDYLRGILADQRPGDDAQIELFTDVLTRAECNKAVRAARTARDQAYGRDE